MHKGEEKTQEGTNGDPKGLANLDGIGSGLDPGLSCFHAR
jgi:hypothetical protein